MEIIDEKQFNELVKLHKKFIFGVVKKYVFTNVKLKDLNAIGLTGFFFAYLNYKPSYNVSLTTYSHNYIKREVIKYQSEIKYPYYGDSQKKAYRLLNKYIDKVFRGYYSEIDLEFLAQKTGLDVEDIGDFYTFGRTIIHLYDDIKNSNDADTKPHIETIEQNLFNKSSAEVEESFLAKVLNERLERLTETQQTVLNKIFGLNNNHKISIQKLSVELNVSTVRVGQIRDQAIYELSKDSELEQIYIDNFSQE